MNNLKPLLILVVSAFTLVFSVQAWSKSSSKFNAPKFMTLQSVGEEPLNMGGYKVDAYTFRSTKGNKDIVKYYKKLWDNKLKTVETDKWIFHSYFDGRYLYSIQVKNSQKGSFSATSSTVGIVSISEPEAIKDVSKGVKIEEFYPISPGTKILTDLPATDLGVDSRTTVFDSSGGLSYNLKHYKLHFKTKGWRVVHGDVTKKMIAKHGATSLIMQKNADELMMSFIPEGGRTKIVSVLVEK